MEGASAKAGQASAGGGDGKSAGARAQDAKVANYLEELKPKVLAAFENDNVGSLPRPELAVRIPIIPVGRGRFPRSLTIAFWEPVLSSLP